MNKTKCLKKFKREAINTVLIYTAILLVVMFGFSACSNNKTEDTNETGKEQITTVKEDSSRTDDGVQFLMDVTEINLKEIKLGQLAQQFGLTPCVKELGSMMVKEHTKCLNELKALATKKSITLPTEISDKGKDAYEKLSNTSGSGFDKEYCDMMVEGHKKVISKFEKASTDCSDTDIKEWIAQTLPSLRKHLDHALSCQKACN
jgi:putative membrane protein